MYSYNIHTTANEQEFTNACREIEKHFDTIKKEKTLVDVDGSLIQVYRAKNGKITVHNDFEVDAVYVDSEVELKIFE